MVRGTLTIVFQFVCMLLNTLVRQTFIDTTVFLCNVNISVIIIITVCNKSTGSVKTQC